MALFVFRRTDAGARHIARWTVVAVLAAAMAGCAGRPGPEVLTPVAAATNAKVVQIYVATNRNRAKPAENVFTAERADVMSFAKFSVAIPPGHKPGEIEWPTGAPDPSVSFATVAQAPLTETQFRDAVAPPRMQRRSPKHKVLVFVHGFNNNFQESLFRLAQMHTDAGVDGIPILFAWPSQGDVAGYAADRQAALASRDKLGELLTMVTASPQVEDVMVVAHSMGGMLTAEALRQLRVERRNRTIARLGRVVLAAPDIDVETFRSQAQTIGPLSPPMTLLVSKDDGALQMSSLVGGGRARAGALDVDNPAVREAAQKAKIQIVDVSRLNSGDAMNHNRFVGLAALYPRLQREASAVRDRSGTFVFDAGGATIARPADGGPQPSGN